MYVVQVFDDNELLNQSMAQPLSGDVDDDDLEQELDELLSGKAVPDLSIPLRPSSQHGIPEFSK